MFAAGECFCENTHTHPDNPNPLFFSPTPHGEKIPPQVCEACACVCCFVSFRFDPFVCFLFCCPSVSGYLPNRRRRRFSVFIHTSHTPSWRPPTFLVRCQFWKSRAAFSSGVCLFSAAAPQGSVPCLFDGRFYFLIGERESATATKPPDAFRDATIREPISRPRARGGWKVRGLLVWPL